jgi:NADH-quinone oxidoreductase subunit L
MYYIILFLPLLSAITTLLTGRYIGSKGAGILTTSSIMITSILSWIALYEIGFNGSPVYVHLWQWITIGTSIEISLGLMYDSLTVIMLVLVTTVSSLVHLYSTSYMENDPHLPRFMAYLSLFTFSMIMLVTADSYILCLWGWESVGICSYLLINYWYTRIQANKSAMKAMIVNRIGDMGLILGMLALFTVFNTLDYATIFSSTYKLSEKTIIVMNIEFHALTLISCLIFIGAVGKSAQLFLHTW